jgi:ABC-2 type transport system permease protein
VQIVALFTIFELQKIDKFIEARAVSLWTMFMGDVLSSFVFGILISAVAAAASFLFGVGVADPFLLCFGLALSNFCFASFSILLSAYPPTDNIATTMMLSSMIKFPLVFISGVLIPIGELPVWGRAISTISPLTYFTDLARYSIQGTSYYPIAVDILALIAFTIAFLFVAIKIHEHTILKRL